MNQKNIESLTSNVLDRLLELLMINADFEIKVQKEGSLSVNVNIEEVEESGLLIGARGSTLNAIQSFLALSLRQKTGEWLPVRLDIGNWRGRHEDYLEELATQTAERALATNEPQYLYNLTPSQRRIIHMAITKRKDVISESQGEGLERHLIVSAKK